MKKLVSILIPMYNEAEVIPLFYGELCDAVTPLCDRYGFEFIFVDDGSADESANLIAQKREEDSRVNLLRLSRNFGKELAMLAGMDFSKGDCLITLDADLQHPPALIPEMLDKWEQGYSDVYCHRLQTDEAPAKKVCAKIFRKILQALSSTDLETNTGDFRLLDRRCVNALCSMRESQRYTKGLYALIGFNKTAIDYEKPARKAGKTKYSFRKLCHLALEGVTSFSMAPLRIASLLGLIVAAIAFVYLIYVVLKAVISGDPVAGYPSLMAVILFLGGTVLLALGIIGEYIGRIFIETKRRPPYFIDSFNGKAQTPR